ncbi:MAG TPA: acetyl-CoA hydrolase [Syntrophus sp. (in: bacteria)]|jgi:acyl-CoA hydrolase/RimJ/RimL family protein N-acetyltransferase|nr:acetyl-CoA hydrolase [Syntrophus sp. (in: bacteria)]
MSIETNSLESWKGKYPEKFASEDVIFSHIHRGNTIFIGSACAEPQYLVQGLIRYIESKPHAFFDAEIIHVRTLGVAPYTEKKFKQNFRHNSFFIGDTTRDAINTGQADYTPILLSQLPSLFHRGLVNIDVALIQTSLPDKHGHLSLGVSLDIVKAAVQKASYVVAQINNQMPRVHGDSFVHMEDIDFLLPYDEPLLEYSPESDLKITNKIGINIARLVEDGDTIQIGYGAVTNAILENLSGKKHLGLHTELFSDGIVELMKKGVIDNTKKTINRGKSVATFCMGHKDTYEFIHDNPDIEFRTIDYTNNPLVIAQHENLVAINSALEIDLTGQATAESIGKILYSGIGGQADFMRGAFLSRNGRAILALPATAVGESISRITPTLKEGAGTTLIRGDVHYVVTEYGIAYIHGKSIRERAMDLIAIAHPKFRPWLVEEAKKAGIIYQDQAFIPGEKGRYPWELESYKTTKAGFKVFFRPIKISDEPLLKDFVYSLSDNSLYRRFISVRKDMPHERLQEFVVIDYTKEMAIVAMVGNEDNQEIVGVGRYFIDESKHSAEVAFAVRDEYHKKGIGTELLAYMTYLAKRQGILGFTADVLADNKPMLHVFENGGFEIVKHNIAGIYEMTMSFKE